MRYRILTACGPASPWHAATCDRERDEINQPPSSLAEEDLGFVPGQDCRVRTQILAHGEAKLAIVQLVIRTTVRVFVMKPAAHSEPHVRPDRQVPEIEY